jgi:hypothetical protein
MKNIFITIREHWLIFFIAIIIGMASSLPQYLVTKTVKNFQGIYRGIANDQIYYEVRAKDVLDGHSSLSNPYLYEHKDGLPMQFWLPDYIMSKPIGWINNFTNFPVAVGFIIWTGILNFIGALLTYSVFYVLTQKKSWSIFGTLFLNVILLGETFLRVPSPAFNFLFWISTLLCLLLYLKEKKKIYAVLTTASFGLLFHFYPYYWTFYTLFFGIFLVSSYIFKLKNISYKIYFGIVTGAFVIGIPYFVSVFKSSKLLTYDESVRRLGLISTHFPSGFDSVVLGLIVMGLIGYVYKKGYVVVNEVFTVLFSLVVSSVVIVNQHVITGKNLEFSSHYLLGNIYSWTVASIYLLFVLYKNLDIKYKSVFARTVFVVVVLLSTLSLWQIVKLESTYSSDEIYVQKYRPIFDWLNINASKDEVIYGDNSFSQLLPVYTSQNVYYSNSAILFFMSDQEVYDRFIINNYFEDFTPDYILFRDRFVFGGYYINNYSHIESENKVRKIFGLSLIPNEIQSKIAVDNVISRARQIQHQGFKDAIKSYYKVDYVVWDKTMDSKWNVENQPFLKEVYSVNGIVIYKVN